MTWYVVLTCGFYCVVFLVVAVSRWINLNLSWLWYVRLVCFLLVLDGSDFLGGFGSFIDGYSGSPVMCGYVHTGSVIVVCVFGLSCFTLP